MDRNVDSSSCTRRAPAARLESSPVRRPWLHSAVSGSSCQRAGRLAAAARLPARPLAGGVDAAARIRAARKPRPSLEGSTNRRHQHGRGPHVVATTRRARDSHRRGPRPYFCSVTPRPGRHLPQRGRLRRCLSTPAGWRPYRSRPMRWSILLGRAAHPDGPASLPLPSPPQDCMKTRFHYSR